MPTVVLQRAFEGDLFLCVRLCQFLLRGKTLPPYSIFGAAYRLISVSKQRMTQIAQIARVGVGYLLPVCQRQDVKYVNHLSPKHDYGMFNSRI